MSQWLTGLKLFFVVGIPTKKDEPKQVLTFFGKETEGLSFTESSLQTVWGI